MYKSQESFLFLLWKLCWLFCKHEVPSVMPHVPACYYSACGIYKHLVDDSDCFGFSSLTDTASYFIHMCRLNFVQIVRKVFSIPLRCKIYEKGNCTRQMWTANRPPCDGDSTNARSQIGSVQVALAHCMSQDYQMIGQWPKTCLVMLAFADCLACRAVCELLGLSHHQTREAVKGKVGLLDE